MSSPEARRFAIEAAGFLDTAHDQAAKACALVAIAMSLTEPAEANQQAPMRNDGEHIHFAWQYDTRTVCDCHHATVAEAIRSHNAAGRVVELRAFEVWKGE